MENVSHLFLFKGKLQTKSPVPPKMWSPPRISYPMPQICLSFKTGGLLPKPANLTLLLWSVQKRVAPCFCAYN